MEPRRVLRGALGSYLHWGQAYFLLVISLQCLSDEFFTKLSKVMWLVLVILKNILPVNAF